MNYDIKPERIEIESRRTNRKVSRERPLWVDIMLGIVGAMIAIWAIWFAGITFFAWGLSKTVEASAEKARLHQVQESRMRAEELRQQQRIQQLNSPQCRFWTDHYRKNGDQRSLENMRSHCPK
ncbi:hypothetical protein [Nitrincola alkalisediminis]|uniref:hypothetical protein n=1 Tax=Nitrincola alkalisediminis TaxID=1366656 RepID=UPI0018744B87|nr:hypothetical protein [Nitrincola alkalisediminis]